MRDGRRLVRSGGSRLGEPNFYDTGKASVLGIGPGLFLDAGEHDKLFANLYFQPVVYNRAQSTRLQPALDSCVLSALASALPVQRLDHRLGVPLSEHHLRVVTEVQVPLRVGRISISPLEDTT